MLSRYYSLDECYDRELVLDHLENLQNESLIVYELVESETFKIKDIGLSEKQTKDLINFFHDNDVIDYVDYEPYNEDDDEDDDYCDDEDDPYNDGYY
jgi:hypothetical protein